MVRAEKIDWEAIKDGIRLCYAVNRGDVSMSDLRVEMQEMGNGVAVRDVQPELLDWPVFVWEGNHWRRV